MFSFHRHAPSRIFPQSCRLMGSRSSAALQAYVGFISTHGKKREHGTHALAEVRSLLIFARQVDWFGMVWVRDGKSIAETESQGLKDHRSMGERSTAS